MVGKRGTTLERFERSYIPEPNSGCWLWEKALTKTGYGELYCPPRNMVKAYVVAYELFKGPRNGMHVMHNCDMPCCVNPDHLSLGTHQENIAQRDARGRQYDRNGEKNGRVKLNAFIVQAIRADKRPPRFIARETGIPYSTVQKVRRRATWKHL